MTVNRFSSFVAKMLCGVILAAFLFVPSTAKAQDLERLDLGPFSLELPDDAEIVDSTENTILIGTPYDDYSFYFQLMEIDDEYDPTDELISFIENMDMDADSTELLVMDTEVGPLFCVRFEDGPFGSIAGFLGDTDNGVGLFLLFASNPSDLEGLLYILSTLEINI